MRQEEIEVLPEKPVPVLFVPPQIPNVLATVWIRASAMKQLSRVLLADRNEQRNTNGFASVSLAVWIAVCI